MADYEFPADQYPAVRAAIGLDANTANVPDDMLALNIYKGEAERFVMRNLTAEQYSDTAWSKEADYAATLFLASLIVPSMRVVISERIAGGNMTYANVNLQEIAAGLESRAEARIADIQAGHPVVSGAPDRYPNPNFFAKAPRRRCGNW